MLLLLAVVKEAQTVVVHLMVVLAAVAVVFLGAGHQFSLP
jgi:hypothetical protein